MDVYSLSVNVLSALGLSPDSVSLTGVDSIVTFKTKMSDEKSTRLYEKSVNPFWCEVFQVDATLGEDIIFQVKNNPKNPIKKIIGTGTYHVDLFAVGESVRKTLKLAEGGELNIKVTCDTIKAIATEK
ncbi:hypothetical protein EIN_095190 [Entamoeba invadens IP1]|uniref:C2 domain-containing protein n=1 Tax=Entamoeba invadens IP1 TaxID=370355 RepID=A0A0A1U071_ENTIV|nr:hypothetical protein EIN_095190 [Entamoeba invadens IP1]ELP87282.1 hypothetical protein EIN_095190 [Entamoeba invadens IP1]|eukprot:XP_004254053.1 hypothetical protein EIN_095190 [Entamoeba invadens IP1]